MWHLLSISAPVHPYLALDILIGQLFQHHGNSKMVDCIHNLIGWMVESNDNEVSFHSCYIFTPWVLFNPFLAIAIKDNCRLLTCLNFGGLFCKHYGPRSEFIVFDYMTKSNHEVHLNICSRSKKQMTFSRQKFIGRIRVQSTWWVFLGCEPVLSKD